jgi:histidine triad (HIT) family protein
VNVNIEQSCIFCRIIEKKTPAKIIFEDNRVIAFEDAHPQAPIHILIIPRKHIIDIHSTTAADRELIGHLFFIAKTIACRNGLESNGYRMVINNGSGAGQSVFHIHLHLLSGRKFAWPPG